MLDDISEILMMVAMTLNLALWLIEKIDWKGSEENG